jgi:hypothetical protein
MSYRHIGSVPFVEFPVPREGESPAEWHTRYAENARKYLTLLRSVEKKPEVARLAEKHQMDILLCEKTEAAARHHAAMGTAIPNMNSGLFSSHEDAVAYMKVVDSSQRI